MFREKDYYYKCYCGKHSKVTARRKPKKAPNCPYGHGPMKFNFVDKGK